MANANTVYVAKKANTLANPITNDSIFVASDNTATSAFVSLYDLVGGSGTTQPTTLGFYVRAQGKVTTGTSSTFIYSLYYSPGARSSITYNGTSVSAALVSITSGSIATTSDNWVVEAELYWDYTSKNLNGIYWGIKPTGSTAVTQTATTQVTSVDLSVLSNVTPVGAPGLICGCHFGSTNASNVATLSEFVVEVL